MNELEKYQKAYYDDSGDTELLYATGALKLDTIAHNENLYILSELGTKLLKYGMLRSVHIDKNGGSSVTGMLTDENVISNEEIQSLIYSKE